MSVREHRSDRKVIPSSSLSFHPAPSSSPPSPRVQTILALLADDDMSSWVKNPHPIREEVSCMGVKRDEVVVDLVSAEGAVLWVQRMSTLNVCGMRVDLPRCVSHDDPSIPPRRPIF